MNQIGKFFRPNGELRFQLILKVYLVTLSIASVVACQAASPVAHIVISDGHPLTVWSKEVDQPRGLLLLLHGRTWSSLPDFDLQATGENLSFMDGLNELGYSVWALDARGYGATPRDATGWMTPHRAVADVVATLHWLANRSEVGIHLFGWSYGSMVAQLVGQQHNSLIKSVILFGYPLSPTYTFSTPTDNWQPALRINTAESAASDFITPGAISTEAISAYVEQALAADPVRTDWRNLEQWSQLDASKLNVPALLLQAEFDPLAHEGTHASTFLGIPNKNKQWVVLAGGDHAALLEKPRAKMLFAIGAFIEWLGR